MKQVVKGASEQAPSTTRFSELFASMINHELRNALNAVSAAASLLELRGDGDDRIRTPASRITVSAARLDRMLSQLVDFTRIELDGALVLIREPLDLLELTEAVLDELPVEHRARVVLKSDDDVQGRWDRDRLAQALATLIGNALQHGAEGGQARVTIQRETSSTMDDTLVVDVESEGAMSGEALAGLFVPKRRPAPANPSRGLGLGLFVAKHVALAHGGQLEVRSSQGRTRFTLRIPAQPAPTLKPQSAVGPKHA